MTQCGRGCPVGGGDGARGGRLAGAGAADDQREIVRGRRMEDGVALVGRQRRGALQIEGTVASEEIAGALPR
jgi:hypothetical protein